MNADGTIDEYTRVVRCAEFPRWRDLDSDTIYLLERDGEILKVKLCCPGGCGDFDTLPVGSSPPNTVGAHWNISLDEHDRVTLAPSVDGPQSCRHESRGRRCVHFFLRGSRVERV